MRVTCLLILSLVCCSALVYADAALHEYRLGNGLQLLVQEDHRAPVVVTQSWYKVGSSYEHDGITGISHVLEHMMFKGTPQYPAGLFARRIAERGGQENALTSRDYTAYFQRLERSQLGLSFALAADRMHFHAVAFLHSPYRQPVLGWMSNLASLTVDQVRAWYRRWYMPNNAVVVVVGDVNPAAVRALAEEYCGSIPAGDLTPPLLSAGMDFALNTVNHEV